eukprot:243252-Prorocentrum_lima.AAC.1
MVEHDGIDQRERTRAEGAHDADEVVELFSTGCGDAEAKQHQRSPHHVVLDVVGGRLGHLPEPPALQVAVHDIDCREAVSYTHLRAHETRRHL